MEQNDETKEEKLKCVCCGRELALGWDVIQVEEGVIGPRGLIPLDKELLFCGEKCLRNFFDDSIVEKLPRRIP